MDRWGLTGHWDLVDRWGLMIPHHPPLAVLMAQKAQKDLLVRSGPKGH